MSTVIWVLRSDGRQILYLGSFHMRAISKILTGSLIASAALAVSACGPKTETTTDNTMVTDMNATEGMDTMTDNMTAVDGSMNGGMMANDTMMTNDTMMSNDTMTNAM
jgi:hypothetical protein